MTMDGQQQQMQGPPQPPPVALTQNIMRTIYEAPEMPVDPPEAVVQVIHIKKIPTGGAGNATAPDRYRLLLSDGDHYMQAMLTTQLNEHITSNSLAKNGVVKLTKYICNSVSSKRIIIVLGMENLTPYSSNLARVGNPVSLDGVIATDGPGGAPGAGQQVPQQQQQQQPASIPNPNMHQQQQPSQYQVQDPNKNLGPQFNANTNQHAPAAPSASMDARHIIMIKSLNPYQNKWTIMARVINKGDVRTWNKGGRAGRLFSFTVADESGEIRVTGFNDSVNAFYDIIQEGQVYYISKGTIKTANRAFNNTNNDYEMTIEPGTTISVCEDPSSVPQIRYNTLELARLGELDKDATVDVLAVVKECAPASEIMTKANAKLKKRDLTIVDESGWSVRLTLWGRQAETFEHHDNPVIGIKGARVGDFGGRSLSTMQSSSMTVNPTIPEAYRLRGWYDAHGKTMNFQSYSSGMMGGSAGGVTGGVSKNKTISQIKDENLGMSEKPDYCHVRGTIVFLKNENAWYPACPNEACKNKKIVTSGYEWRCEKCERAYPQPNYRYIASCSVCDYTGQMWMSNFNETMEKILGKSANEMAQLCDDNKAEYDAIFQRAVFKQYLFDVRCKSESYQDETKMRTTIMSIKEIDYAAASREMIATLETVLGRV